MEDSPTELSYTPAEHQQHMEERKGLIEAARESAKSYDQAILAFGSAVFGASVAFLKDVAPHPLPYTLVWLTAAWTMFSVGLLSTMLSFLFSGKACMFEIEAAATQLQNPKRKRRANRWSTATEVCNYLSVILIFSGLISWSHFALANLNGGRSTLDNKHQPNNQEERAYVPPPPPLRVPTPQTPNPSQNPGPAKQ